MDRSPIQRSSSSMTCKPWGQHFCSSRSSTRVMGEACLWAAELLMVGLPFLWRPLRGPELEPCCTGRTDTPCTCRDRVSRSAETRGHVSRARTRSLCSERSLDISVRGVAGFAALLDDIFGGHLLLKLSLLLALSLGALFFLACQLFLPFLEGLTWAHPNPAFLRVEHARCGIAGPGPVWSVVLR